ncbi:MAG: hypothetical protein JRF65_03975 [Deltaproteobacteria bacterium]|nr:hypothetical protein [Deltaproteobacteria bacterium]
MSSLRHPFFPLRPGSSGPDDVEVLQTDVMRFIAILGICLMVIFALVKTLPIAPPDNRPVVVDREMLAQEARRLSMQVREYRRMLSELRAKVDEVAGEAEEAAAVTQQAARMKTAVEMETKKAEYEMRRLAGAIDDVEGELEKRRSELAAIYEAVSNGGRAVSTVKREIGEEKRKLLETRRDIMRAEALMAKVQGKQKAPEKPLPKNPASQRSAPPKDKKTGYTLRFETDTALNALVARGEVSFYAMAGKQAWRFTLKGGKSGYETATVPPMYYEMDLSTVPATYLAAVKRVVSAFGRDTLVFGVTLPQRTREAVRQLMTPTGGGNLIIDRKGLVRLEDGAGGLG